MTSAKKPAQPENNEDRLESLQERSARLEAEAEALLNGDGFDPDGDPLMPEELPAQDTATIETLKAELQTAKDQTLRALAEADNARKRAAREREDAAKYSIAAFARDLIAVADNLRRALEAAPADLAAGDARVKSILEGIEATERELLKNFDRHGIRKIEPLGEVFNPNFHEVMFEAPGTGKPPGTIIQVIEVGYVLNDRLLRPARVGVAKNEGNGGAGGHIDTQA